MSQLPSYGLGCLTVEDSRTHTHTHTHARTHHIHARAHTHTHTHTLGRTPLNLVIIHKGRCLHNTQQTQQRSIHAFSGIRTPNLNSRTSADIYLRPHAIEFVHAQLSFCMFWYLRVCFEIATGIQTTFIPSHSPLFIGHRIRHRMFWNTERVVTEIVEYVNR